MSEEDLLGLRANSPEKQAMAWFLKKQTTVTGVWLASRLQMGNRSNVARALSAISGEISSTHKTMKRKMTQCTG